MRTVLEVFNTLTFDQKNRVYQINSDILENNRNMDVKYVNLSFLSNQEQKNVVRLIINHAISPLFFEPVQQFYPL